MFASILDGIGATPMLRLDKLAGSLPGSVLVKLESRNPGGSIKDRVAYHLLRAALCDGSVQPGGTVVEGTSGNMGIGIALCARALGLKAVLAMPESMSLERRKLLAGFGAELVLTPAAEGMNGAVAKAEEIVKERGAFLVGQFTNPKAPEAHYVSTGPEILAQTEGQVAAVVAGVGSGSTIMGVGRYLKERVPGVKAVAVEPAESALLSTGKAGPHGIQGIGANFVPAIVDRRYLDAIQPVKTQDAIDTARRLMQIEGISCGISSGANVFAALQLAALPEYAGRNIVTFICDTGERYLSTALYA
ncbi:MAG: cysteine synthase A [Desulfovibrionaceae bacterium]|nr:cysteine synthase A [Desulfovibrionaceae bacterium]